MRVAIKELWRYREAIRNLAMLNLRVRYSNSAFGFLWSLGNPLFFMVIFTFVFSILLPSSIQNYPIFVLSAMLPWNFFQTATMGFNRQRAQWARAFNETQIPRRNIAVSLCAGRAD